MVNNIKNNTISEAHAKHKLNALNEIKKAEIKVKCLISGQKKLLNLFDKLIKTIFDDNLSVNEDDNKSVNEDDNVSVNEDDNVSVNEDDNDVSVNKDDNDNESESESGDEQYYKIKQLNNYFRTIDETKSFEEQIEILKKKRFFR